MMNLDSLVSILDGANRIASISQLDKLNGYICGVGSDTETCGRYYPELDTLVENVKNIVSKR